MRKTVEQMVREANAQIQTVPVLEAIDLLGQPEVVLVDLRDIRELQREGVIPGAYHAPRGMLEFWVDPESEYHKKIFSSGKRFVFFCAAGWRSALATLVVQEMGLEPVCHIGGGFGAWKEVGGPIEEWKPREKKA